MVNVPDRLDHPNQPRGAGNTPSLRALARYLDAELNPHNKAYHDHSGHHDQSIQNLIFTHSTSIPNVNFLPTGSTPLFYPGHSSSHDLAPHSPPISTYDQRSSYIPPPFDPVQGNSSNHSEANSHTTPGIPHVPASNGYHSAASFPPPPYTGYPSNYFEASSHTTSGIPHVPASNGYHSSASFLPPPYTGYPSTTATSPPSLSPFSMTDRAFRDSPYPNQFEATSFTVKPTMHGHHSSTSTPTPPYPPPSSVPNPASSSYMPIHNNRSNPIHLPCSQESQNRKQAVSLAKTRRKSQSAEPNFPLSRQKVGSKAMTKAGKNRRKDQVRDLFYCPVRECTSEGFTEEHNLLYHMLSHEDKRPYPCPKCGKYFRGKGDLKRHIEKKKRPCA